MVWSVGNQWTQNLTLHPLATGCYVSSYIAPPLSTTLGDANSTPTDLNAGYTTSAFKSASNLSPPKNVPDSNPHH